MWTYQSATVFWASLAVLPLVTSVIYYLATPKAAPVAKRVAVSAHGLVIALLHVTAVYVAASQMHEDKYGLPFAGLCAVAAGLVVYSFRAFRGSKQIHWLQALNIIWLFGLFFLGGMAVTGRWL